MSAEDFTKVFENRGALKSYGFPNHSTETPDNSTLETLAHQERPLSIVARKDLIENKRAVLKTTSEQGEQALAKAKLRLLRANLVSSQDVSSNETIERTLDRNRKNKAFQTAAKDYYGYERNVENQIKRKALIKNLLLSSLGSLAKKLTQVRLPIIKGVGTFVKGVKDNTEDWFDRRELSSVKTKLGYQIRPPETNSNTIGGEQPKEKNPIPPVYRLAMSISLILCAGFLLGKDVIPYVLPGEWGLTKGLQTYHDSFNTGTDTFSTRVKQGNVNLGAFQGIVQFINPGSNFNPEVKAVNYQPMTDWIRTGSGLSISLTDNNETVDKNLDVYFANQKKEKTIDYLDSYILTSSADSDSKAIINNLESNGVIPTSDQFQELVIREFSGPMKSEIALNPQNADIIRSQYLEIIHYLVVSHPELIKNQFSFAFNTTRLVIDNQNDKYVVLPGKLIISNPDQYNSNLTNALLKLQQTSDQDLLKLLQQ